MSVLTYKTVAPPSSPTKRSGLMLLHGVGANELNMVPLAEAADNRFAVISVRAPSLQLGELSAYRLVKVSSDERVLAGYFRAASAGDEGVHLWLQRWRFQSLVRPPLSLAHPVPLALQCLA